MRITVAIVLIGVLMGCSSESDTATSTSITAGSGTISSTFSPNNGTTQPNPESPDGSSPTQGAAEATIIAPLSVPSPTTEPVPTTDLAAGAHAPTIAELIASDRVLNIAHAGGDQDAPHSTMFAFKEAIKAGADMLEFDVRLTADGVLVVYHDADTAGTTGQALTVVDTDLATLQTLDNAYWWGPECWRCDDRAPEAYIYRGVRTGETPPPAGYTAEDFRIVTLAEVADAFPEMPLDIEIKGEGEEGLAAAAALAKELAELDRLDSVVVVSFDAAVVEAFHTAAPEVATSPGVNEMAEWLLGDGVLAEYHDVIQIPPMYEDIEVLNVDTLAKAEAAGVAVWVWPNDVATQETGEYYSLLIEMGVDGIIAGRPLTATTAINT